MIELKSHKNDLLQQRNSELASAEVELKSTVVRAPSDGYVTHVRVRPGMIATSLPFRPVMTFVPKQEHYVLAAFRQNAMQRLKSGYEAEVMFSAIPGKVFKAEVVQVQPALAEGEMQASGTLMTTRELKLSTTGLAPVLVRVKDDLSGYILPDGVYAEVAIYSDQMHHVAIMRKILLRMKSWQSYIYLDH
jgi:multidrug resistance efflux pump